MSIINHVEKFLGKIANGWSDKNDSKKIQVASFNYVPADGLRTLLTLGLSNHTLRISETKNVRQEILLVVYETVLIEKMVSLLLSLCDAIIVNHKALLRGKIIRLSNEIADNTQIPAIYCSMPVIFDDGFATYEGTDPSTVMVWAIPIFEEEANFIDREGWEKFEDILEANDPDLFDLERSIVI